MVDEKQNAILFKILFRLLEIGSSGLLQFTANFRNYETLSDIRQESLAREFPYHSDYTSRLIKNTDPPRRYIHKRSGILRTILIFERSKIALVSDGNSLVTGLI